MALTLPVGGGGGDFKQVPAGSHLAVCNMVVDLGIQPGSGQYPEPKRQIMLRWEIPAERVEYEVNGVKKEGPQTISRTLTASMNEKATLRKLLENWRGKKFSDEDAATFDVASVLGKACLLTVSETVKGDKVYANVSGVGPLVRGMTAPKAENDLLYYDRDDQRAFEKLPKWVREKIDGQLEPQSEAARDDKLADSRPDFEDDINF
jgi:hypothetical protein